MGDTGWLDASRTQGGDDSPLQYATDPALAALPDRYVLADKLGEGGMGVVYRAYDKSLDRDVAIKLLAKRSVANPRAEARLLREAEALARLAHPNIVTVFEARAAARCTFIAMELLHGPTLRQWLAKRPRRWQEVLEVFLQAGTALSVAHDADLVHRDFKPQNVIVADDGRARVLDFGLARATMSSDAADTSDAGGSSHLSDVVTGHGALLGTPAYMSPEQHAGDTATAASDQYGFCVALYEALYGRRPFADASAGKLFRAKLRGKIRPPARTGVPRQLRPIVLRGLSANPDQRWASMAELLDALRGVGSTKRRTTTVGALALLVGFGAVLAAPITDDDATRCSVDNSALSTVWNPARRERVEAAIVATDLAYSYEARARVVAGLDAYARKWSDAYVEACGIADEAQRDADLACLRDAVDTLDQYAAQLEGIEARAMTNVGAIVGSLPSVSECLDAGAGRARPDPAIEPEVSALQAEARQINALRVFGLMRDAVDVGEGLLLRARVLGYAPLVGDIEYELGMALRSVGRHEESLEHITNAYFAAVDAGDQLEGIRRAAALVLANVGDGGDIERATLWHKRVMALAENVDAPVHVALAHTYLAVGYRQAGRYDEAVDSAQRALDTVEHLDDVEPAVLAVLHGNLAGGMSGRGEFAAAAVELRRSAQYVETAVGTRHPQTATIYANLGETLRRGGEPDEGLRWVEKAFEVFSANEGANGMRTAMVSVNLGNAYEEAGRNDDAREHWQKALAVLEMNAPDSDAVATVHNNLGQLATKEGDLDGAVAHFERALAIREATLGPNHERVASVLLNYGLNRIKAGDHADAERRLEHALEVYEAALGPDHPDTTKTRARLVELRTELDAP